MPGATVRLERAGQPDVVATRVRVADDGRSLAGLLNLAGRQRAAWDVVVANPPGRGTDTLVGAFTVEAVRAPSLWTRIDGGGVARPDQPYTAMLAFGNTGNVDATGVSLHLDGIPSFDRVDLPVEFPPGLVEERAGEGRSTKLYISRLAPGSTYAPVQPFFRGSGTRTMRARIFGDTFDPGDVPTIDPAISVSMQVDQATDPATTSPARLRGTYRVTGPGGGDIAFDYTLTNAGAHAEPAIGLTRPSAGVLRYRLTGTVELGAQIKAYDVVLTGPEGAFAAAQRAGNLRAASGGLQAPAKLGGDRRDGPNPLDIADAHASGIQAISQNKLIDCLLDPPNGHAPITLDPATVEQLRRYAKGGADAGTLSLVPVPGGVLGELAWESATEAAGFTLFGSFNSVLGSALGNAAFNDPTLPQSPGANPENQTGFLDPDFEDRIAAAIVWCAPPPPPATPPPGGGAGEVFKTVRVTNSRDPNEKAGPDGFGAQRYIEGDEPLPYVVRFENVASATAPAQVVRITDQLDPAEVRLSSVSLGPIQFGDVFAGPPPGLRHWTTDIDLRPEQNLVVRVDADLDASELTWEFTSLDPDTLQPTTDPLAGFLPPNDNPPEGEGAVYFSAEPAGALTSGDPIDNDASIVFDTNAPIVTNDWLNTIDDDLPTSQVGSVTRTGGTNGCATDLAVAWAGSDAGSGVGGFDVYVSVDGGPYGLWRSQTTATGDTYPGQAGHTYRFYSVAHDRAGHFEPAPAAADASATVVCETTPPPPPPSEPPANPDRDAPETTITKGPAKKSEKRKAKFKFESDDPDATFECKLDRKKWKLCSSPRKYKVGEGKHKFRVRATDAAGNTDSSPAKAKFRVVG